MAFLFLLLGFLANSLFGQMGGYAQRAFLLSFGACVFVAGVVQTYSQEVFGTLTTTIDSLTYWNLVESSLNVSSLNDLPPTHTPLAIFVWAKVLHFFNVIGIQYGIWTVVLFNSFLVGLSANLAVRAGYHVFGNDRRRLRLIGTLFALCGMFWLFGSLLLRDAFLLFDNIFLLWAFLRALNQANTKNMLLVLGVGIFTFISMYFLRKSSAPMVLIFSGFFLFSLMWERRNIAKFLAIASAVIMLLIVFHNPILDLLNDIQKFFFLYSGTYSEKMFAIASSESLYYQLIMSQPLIIRIPAAAFLFFIFPLPLWTYLQVGVTDYHLIKTWQGFYLVAITPLIIVGAMELFQHVKKFSPKAKMFLFILVHAVFSTLAVAGTTSETRHLGQFMPALLLLAAVPDKNLLSSKQLLKKTSQVWFVIVALLHLAWIVLKVLF